MADVLLCDLFSFVVCIVMKVMVTPVNGFGHCNIQHSSNKVQAVTVDRFIMWWCLV